MLAVVLAISIISVLFEYRTLYNNKMKREITLSAILMLAGITLTILRFMNIPVPSLLSVIRFMFEPAGQFLVQLFT